MNDLTGTIYKVTNKVTGKSYIGQTTKTIAERFQQHCRRDSQCKKLANSIQKYGKGNFTIESIYTVNATTEEQLHNELNK